MRFTLVESIGEKKVATIPEIDRWMLDRRAKRSNRRMQIVTLPVKTLVDDNNLLNDTSMACRRDFIWGNDPKKYHYKDHLVNWLSYPIIITKSNGKYRILDGHHRIMALYNDGYEEAEVVLEESNKVNEDTRVETDSEGNPLSKEQIEFFKDSKVRDKQGRLLVCYHNSESEFDEFDKGRVGSEHGGIFGKGFYFFTSKELGKTYGEIQRAFYVNLKNPFDYYSYSLDDIVRILDKSGYEYEKDVLDSIGDADIWDLDLIDGILSRVLVNADEYNVFSDILIKSGYDGIIADEEIVVFEPNQIKSISNKTPTYRDNINEEN